MPFVSEKTGKGTTEELIVFPGEMGGDPDGIGVLVDGRTGKVTNRWGDGTAGLNEEAREMAAEEVEAYMPYTMERFVWKHDTAPPKTVVTYKTRKVRKTRKSSPSTSLGSMR